MEMENIYSVDDATDCSVHKKGIKKVVRSMSFIFNVEDDSRISRTILSFKKSMLTKILTA